MMKIKKNSISNLIKSIIYENLYIIAENWISKFSPNIPMKTWIIKIKNKNRLPPGVFLFKGPIWQVLFFIFIIQVFIGILG